MANAVDVLSKKMTDFVNFKGLVTTPCYSNNCVLANVPTDNALSPWMDVSHCNTISITYHCTGVFSGGVSIRSGVSREHSQVVEVLTGGVPKTLQIVDGNFLLTGYNTFVQTFYTTLFDRLQIVFILETDPVPDYLLRVHVLLKNGNL